VPVCIYLGNAPYIQVTRESACTRHASIGRCSSEQAVPAPVHIRIKLRGAIWRQTRGTVWLAQRHHGRDRIGKYWDSFGFTCVYWPLYSLESIGGFRSNVVSWALSSGSYVILAIDFLNLNLLPLFRHSHWLFWNNGNKLRYQ